MVLTARSGSFSGVGSAVVTPGIEDARARSSGMIMKSLSGSTGALDKALPRDRRAKTDSTRESSRSEGVTAGGSDLVASLQADCRGAWTHSNQQRQAAATTALAGTPDNRAVQACTLVSAGEHTGLPPCISRVPPPRRAAQATARRLRRCRARCRPNQSCSPNQGETLAWCRWRS